jgi:hypothetical protein
MYGTTKRKADRKKVARIALVSSRLRWSASWTAERWLPVTHRPPENAAAAVEIPRTVKLQLGLDDDRSWVVVSEGDQFVWPGYDLRKVRSTDRYDYGYLPPRFFNQILDAFMAWHRASKARLISRE